MAEPLKDRFGPEIPTRIADMIVAVHPHFDAAGFVADSLDGYDELELTVRARHIAAALASHLPADRAEALSIIVDSLDTTERTDGTGMDGFVYLPHVYFVADYGLDDFEAAMTAQYELTKRFTAEFSIRAFIDRYPDDTLARLRVWTGDPSVDVRRLVSEGTRPRLPWAPRLDRFIADPAPVVDLLELLKDDSEEYVRRSVANNLNDIAKDHPELVVEIAERWWIDGDENRRRLIRHGLRTLVKRGHQGALDVLGFGGESRLQIAKVTIAPDTAAIGDRVRIEVDLTNPTDGPAASLVDLRVHFVKANGSTSPKVFKGKEVEVDPGATATVRKTISVAQHSTRTHYPGAHRVDLLVNGAAHEVGWFELVDRR